MRIGLIGLGNMGARIGKRLIEQGKALSVFDLNMEALTRFQSLGAKVARSPKDLAADNEYVITCLPNANIVRNVVLGEHGLLSGFKAGSTLIDMTSSDPAVTKEIGKELSQCEVYMMDAPVSGGLKKAEEGALSIMAGGSEETFAKCLPVLRDIGTNITHVGELGSGHTIKALNNLICAATLSITAEAMALGVKMGLDANKMLQVINTSSGRNHSSEVKFPDQVLTRKFEVGFTIDLMSKDVSVALDMAKNANVPMFVSGAISQLWKYAVSQGGGDMDHTAIAKFVEQMAGVEIKG